MTLYFKELNKYLPKDLCGMVNEYSEYYTPDDKCHEIFYRKLRLNTNDFIFKYKNDGLELREFSKGRFYLNVHYRENEEKVYVYLSINFEINKIDAYFTHLIQKEFDYDLQKYVKLGEIDKKTYIFKNEDIEYDIRTKFIRKKFGLWMGGVDKLQIIYEHLAWFKELWNIHEQVVNLEENKND
jgi:hypothetical protein